MAVRKIIVPLCLLTTVLALVVPAASREPGEPKHRRDLDRRAVLGPDYEELWDGR